MTTPLMLEVLDDPVRVAQRVAAWLCSRAAFPASRTALLLSGGSTPRALYALLAQEPWRSRVPWHSLHVFWGDERFVPPDHPYSNYRMAYAALLAHVPLGPQSIHAIPTSGTPEAAAGLYEAMLKEYYGADRLDPARPLFDIALLGLGADGHTASLFAGGAEAPPEQWVIAVDGEPARVSLTYAALGSSRASAFLVTGADKRDAVSALVHGDRHIPAARIGALGELHCFADAEAAGDLAPSLAENAHEATPNAYGHGR